MLTATLVFLLTYLVLGLQRVPRLHIGRPAGALLGAVAMVAFGVIDFDTATRAIDLDTLLFLLGMMIVVAYLELSGFFELVERRILGWARSPRALLVLVVVSSGLLSALFMNDTVCLLATPVVVRVCRRLELRPVPYLIALATAANVGSACSIVGNPQNALIAVRSGIGLVDFAARLAPVTVVGLALVAAIVTVLHRREITGVRLVVPPPREPRPIQRGMLAASLVAGAGLVVGLALGARPAAAAMTAAAAVVLAGSARPREALREIDWSLLLLFGGLFVVMRGVEVAGLADRLVRVVTGSIDAAGPLALARLGASVTVLSQAVSNVPAVLLFVPGIERLPEAAAVDVWLALAAFSTLAGNWTILGSVANVIVLEVARRDGVEIGFVEYLRVGGPVAASTLVLAWVVLAIG